MQSAARANPPPREDSWVQLHAQLLRYARSKVRNAALAEDAVSETVVAALQTELRFESAVHRRAWMVGVLKHKLVDELRSQSRWVPLDAGDDESGEAGEAGAPDPATDCAQARLRSALLACCRRLPPVQRAAFTLRELADLDAEEVCDRLGITRNHLWVLLHRARRALREQLQAHR